MISQLHPAHTGISPGLNVVIMSGMSEEDQYLVARTARRWETALYNPELIKRDSVWRVRLNLETATPEVKQEIVSGMTSDLPNHFMMVAMILKSNHTINNGLVPKLLRYSLSNKRGDLSMFEYETLSEHEAIFRDRTLSDSELGVINQFISTRLGFTNNKLTNSPSPSLPGQPRRERQVIL